MNLPKGGIITLPHRPSSPNKKEMITLNIEWLLNNAKQKFYPLTHTKAVLVGENNKTLDTELDSIRGELIDLQDLGLFVKNGVIYDRWEEK